MLSAPAVAAASAPAIAAAPEHAPAPPEDGDTQQTAARAGLLSKAKRLCGAPVCEQTDFHRGGCQFTAASASTSPVRHRTPAVPFAAGTAPPPAAVLHAEARAKAANSPSPMKRPRPDAGDTENVPQAHSPLFAPKVSKPDPPHEPRRPTYVSGSALPAASPPAALGAPSEPVPRCNHRHPLVRSRVEETLACDGTCGLEIPRGDTLWSCATCDFDLCEPCMHRPG
jgi:hypothetical protein